MGSYAGGNVASTLAVDTIREFYECAGIHGHDQRAAEARLALACRHAHREVAHQTRSGVRSLGATVAAIRFENDHVVIGHVGDCRVYRYRSHRLERLTRDHSLREELARTGSDVEARPVGHVLTRTLGIGDDARPDVQTLPAVKGDRFLLCTDGLSQTLTDRVLQDHLAIGSSQDAARGLVRRASKSGRGVNASAVVVTVS